MCEFKTGIVTETLYKLSNNFSIISKNKFLGGIPLHTTESSDRDGR